VRATHRFDQRFRGAVGVAHGGAIAGMLDDLFGFVLVRVLVPAVTRELTVRYLRPVLLDEDCHLDAHVTRRDDRELHMRATLMQRSKTAAEADAVFVEVDPTRLLTPPTGAR
jgi:acyl-coenzyme A thioesterase PaaI-like protein